MRAAEVDPRRPLPPVRWLFGPDMVAVLRSVAIYTLSSSKFDLRDWMQGSVHDFSDRSGEFWFDYVSDTGDGQTAMAAVARLCLSDITLQGAPADALGDGPELSWPLTLPRGEFLFVGGDTAYHIADAQTIKARFCAPFRLAAQQVGLDPQDRRPLFGIPGNHDYYDQLDGYNRLFRAPFQSGEEASPADLPLDVPGFRRVQQASYMAVRLPHGFWLFGMDAEQSRLDARQSAFFRQILRSQGASPLKVIVATPSPPLSLGRAPDAADPAVVPLLDITELAPPFVKRPSAPAGGAAAARESPANRNEIERRAGELPAGHLRLYLSGDVHHYERYFGARSADGQAAACASIVSGGGGAFLYPSHTDFGEVQRRRVYPTPADSRAAMASLFQPWVVLSGGYIPVFGALVAMALITTSALLRPRWGGLDALLHIALRAPSSAGASADLGALEAGVQKVGGILSVVALITAAAAAMVAGARRERLRSARAPSPAAAPPTPRAGAAFNAPILLGWGLLVVASAAVTALAWRTEALWIAYPAVLAGTALAVAGIWQSNRWIRAGTTRLRAAVLTVASIAMAAAVGAAPFALANPELGEARAMVFDFALGSLLLFMLLVAGVGVPLQGAAVHRGAAKKLLFIGFGLFNVALTMAVPFVFVRTLGSATDLAARLGALVIAGAAFTAIGRRVFLSPRRRRWLALVWLALGASWLAASLIGSTGEIGGEISGLRAALSLGLAAALGAVITSTSFGWYFAVADTWDGHANEVGGAARVEQYKQMIRFRVRPEGITAFVIAIDRPTIEPSPPRLVDVFELRPRGE